MKARIAASAALIAWAVPATADAAPRTVPPADHVRTVLRTQAAPVQRPATRPTLPALPRSAAALRRAKRSAERRSAAGAGSSALRAASAPAAVVGGLIAPGLRASDALFAVPPDTTGSIGPGYYVQIVNDAVAVFRRSDLARVDGPVANERFMRRPGLTFVSDPQMQWDPQAGRWDYLAVAFTVNLTTFQPSGPNYLLYGFSKSSDPTDLNQGWCRYSIASGDLPSGDHLLDDFAKLGHDDQHLLFGSNVFAIGANGSQTFVTARIWSVPKPAPGALADCPAAPAATAFGSADSPLRTPDGDLAGTPLPANTADSSSAGYVVAADDATAGPANQIMAWHVGGSAQAPVLVQDGNMTVASYRVPAPARQLFFRRIDTLDGRLTMAVAHADPTAGGQEAVWTQHTVDPGNGSVAMRWYELLPGSGQVRQQGSLSGPLVDVFSGAISPGADGSSAVAVYNRSGPLLLPEIRAQARVSGFPLGVLGPSIRLASSAAPDFDLGCVGVCRWGDYSGASPDPAGSTVVWVDSQTTAKPGGLLPNWTSTIAAIDAAG